MTVRWSILLLVSLQMRHSTAQTVCSKNETMGGSAEGQACHFPFSYNKVMYMGCTTENSGDRLWCGTTENVNQDWKWGYCICSDQAATEAPPTQDPSLCRESTWSGFVCPYSFTYKEKTFQGCTVYENDGTPWCAYDSNYQHSRWENCSTPMQCESSDAAQPCNEETTKNETCAAEFDYYGTTYTGCTTVNHNGVYWCSLTADYTNDQMWGDCKRPFQCYTKKECHETTTGGLDCPTSFSYQNITYTGCTTINNKGTLWCSLTLEYYGVWQNCTTPLQC